VSYHLDLKKYPKNIPKNIPHFLGVEDDFSYENKLDEPKIILECSPYQY
jgi:hypothetical protein